MNELFSFFIVNLEEKFIAFIKSYVMRLLVIILLFGTLLLNCNSPTPAAKNLTIKENITEKPKTTNLTKRVTEGMPPIYEHFDDLAYIFQQQTDTTYIINFWATWCKPCVEELPYFEQLTKKYQGQKVKVILVSLDFKKQLETKLVPFLKEHQIQSEVMVLLDPDANAWVDRVDPSWSGAIPITLVYKNEKRAFYEESFEDYAALEKIVQPFIK